MNNIPALKIRQEAASAHIALANSGKISNDPMNVITKPRQNTKNELFVKLIRKIRLKLD